MNVPKTTSRVALTAALALAVTVSAQEPQRKAKPGRPKAAAKAEVTFPPRLPGGAEIVSDRSDEFLKPPATLRPGVTIAKVPPVVDFLYFPGQTYPGKPWSAWGDSLWANGKYYASVGDHLAPQGNAFVYEYDPAAGRFRQLLDVRKLIGLPDGHYTPGKIHGRLDLGADGWLYCSTHRGSTRVTTDEYHYRGDWIVRIDPAGGRAEVVAHGAVPKHCIPASVLDPRRLIFYGGTAPGQGGDEAGGQFFAYDLKARKLLFAGPDGPSRALIFARSTGRVYFTAGKDGGPLVRFDPERPGPPARVADGVQVRAASEESPQGVVYAVSQGSRGADATLYALDTRSERVEVLGPAAVGTQQYIATLDADPTGRYLYYVPGAHGGSDTDGSAVVQFDTRTRTKKVLAFLHPYYQQKYGCTPRGTYSAAVDERGERLFITWNVSRGGRAWDSCALTVLHIPEAERRP